MTEQFVLILLTLNAKTGALVRADQVGRAFDDASRCVRAAAETGPQQKSGELVRIYTCKADRELDASTDARRLHGPAQLTA